MDSARLPTHSLTMLFCLCLIVVFTVPFFLSFPSDLHNRTRSSCFLETRSTPPQRAPLVGGGFTGREPGSTRTSIRLLFPRNCKHCPLLFCSLKLNFFFFWPCEPCLHLNRHSFARKRPIQGMRGSAPTFANASVLVRLRKSVISRRFLAPLGALAFQLTLTELAHPERRFRSGSSCKRDRRA
jgi:hypothetical protein